MEKRILLLLFLLLSTVIAFGETQTLAKGSWGIVTEFTEDSFWLGGIVHIANALALRPSALMYFNTQTNLRNLGVRTDVLFLFPQSDLLIWHLAIGIEVNHWTDKHIAYSQGWYSFDSDSNDTEYEEIYLDRIRFSQRVLFGAQIMITPNFGVCADVGFIFGAQFSEREPDDDAEPWTVSAYTQNFSLGALIYLSNKSTNP